MRQHRNNIGFLRLLLACAVIVGHAPEMIDGNQSREPIAVLFGDAAHATLGGIAVAGFFLLSGYLITASMLKLDQVAPYLERRVLRIVPGYVVAYIASLGMIGVIMGLDFSPYLKPIFGGMLFLHEPPIFWDQIVQPYHTVNGALWTISFEFRCYFLVCVLWMIGILQNPRRLVLFTMAMLCLAFFTTFESVSAKIDLSITHRTLDWIVGTPSKGIKLSAMFLVGACVYQFRDRVIPRLGASAATFGLLVALFSLKVPHIGEISIFIFGAIPLFWLAFVANLGRLQRINDQWDISYGTYLYGWPVATVLIFLDREIDPWLLTMLALPLALVLGAASWWLVEKWTKNLARPLRPALQRS